MSRLFALSGLAIALLASGCKASEQSARSNGVIRIELGRAPTPQILADISRSTLQSYGFPVANETQDLIQTDWRLQAPADDLQMLGAQQVRDRVEVFIRARGNDYFIANARLTYEVLLDQGWRTAEIPDATLAQYDRLQVAIRERLDRFMNQN